MGSFFEVPKHKYLPEPLIVVDDQMKFSEIYEISKDVPGYKSILKYYFTIHKQTEKNPRRIHLIMCTKNMTKWLENIEIHPIYLIFKSPSVGIYNISYLQHNTNHYRGLYRIEISKINGCKFMQTVGLGLIKENELKQNKRWNESFNLIKKLMKTL